MKYKLTSPATIKDILEKHGFTLSKSLGQNFLTDQNIIDKIIDRADIDKDTYVLEIGPGLGAMTVSLSDKARHVAAVEIDKTLIPVHQDVFEYIDNLDVIYENILDVDLASIQEDYFNGEDFKVVANLPYYITSPIVTNLLTSKAGVSDIVVMMQKEVADRLVARPGTKAYGSLSVFVDYYSHAKILFKVSPNVFIPKPKVESAVVNLKKKPNIDTKKSENLQRLVQASFAKRRKTILNSISSEFDMDKEELKEIIVDSGLDPGSRAEDLSTSDYLDLLASFEKGEKHCYLKKN